MFSKESVDCPLQVRKKFHRILGISVYQSINVLTLTYVYQLWVMSKQSVSQANTRAKISFLPFIGHQVKVEGRCFGQAQLRGGLGADLHTLERLCPPAGLEMPCSAPRRTGGSGQVEGGLGFLTIDTVPLTRTKISRKISRYDIRLCNHMSSLRHAGLSTFNTQ